VNEDATPIEEQRPRCPRCGNTGAMAYSIDMDRWWCHGIHKKRAPMSEEELSAKGWNYTGRRKL
jgi:ribosomal protein S27AE